MSIFTIMSLAPCERTVKVGGKTYRAKFNHNTLARAEQLYATEYKRDVDARVIMSDLLTGKMSALGTLAYAALLEGGTVLAWEEFWNMFNSRDYDPLFDKVSDAIMSMMHINDEDEDEAEGDGDLKNADSHGAN